MFFYKIKNKTKEGKKLKKKKQLEEQEQQEDLDSEPPAPKKKKKKDKLAADQENDHIDMNGNSDGVETPSKKTKKTQDSEVSHVYLVKSVDNNFICKNKCLLCSYTNKVIFVSSWGLEEKDAKENSR